jgi:hypothetical protein
LLSNPLATAVSPGSIATNLTTALTPTGNSLYVSAAEKAKIDATDLLATSAVPAFVANVASIAPGTDNSSEYIIESARALAAAATLTIATTGTPVQGNKYINCHALTLGYVISIVNGGAAAGTIATFPASLTKGRGVALWFDGTNYFFNGYYELGT